MHLTHEFFALPLSLSRSLALCSFKKLPRSVRRVLEEKKNTKIEKKKKREIFYAFLDVAQVDVIVLFSSPQKNARLKLRFLDKSSGSGSSSSNNNNAREQKKRKKKRRSSIDRRRLSLSSEDRSFLFFSGKKGYKKSDRRRTGARRENKRTRATLSLSRTNEKKKKKKKRALC